MPPGSLDDLYLQWLYGQVADIKTRKSSTTYWSLLKKLLCTEFAWIIPNDDNRAEDGRQLRNEWIDETNIAPDPDWMALGCSFLEMLVAISRRLAFETDKDVSHWFWRLIDNVGLTGFNDRSNFSDHDIDDITSVVIWRTYDRNGNGGLFPLHNASRDQRKVELWYQLSEYLLQDT